tara:strand:- start:413 stop:1324 length:912 start_codon:yes stop_codon:yes gene_type:complete
MPKRILRDWTDSLRLADLTAEAERLFTRIIMKADDFGRFHADPRLLASACFPYAQDITPDLMRCWLAELEAEELVVLYEIGPRRFLAVTNFGQRLRDTKSKFPAPTQMAADWLPQFEDGSDPAATRGEPPQPAATGGDHGGEAPQKSASDGDGDGVVCGDGDVVGVVEEHTHSAGVAAFVSPTLEQVLAAADMQGVLPVTAEKFHAEMEACGWISRHGHRLVNWQAALRAYGMSWRAVDHREKGAPKNGGGAGKPEGAWSLRKRMEALEQQRDRCDRSTKEGRTEIMELNRNIEALQKELGGA